MESVPVTGLAYGNGLRQGEQFGERVAGVALRAQPGGSAVDSTVEHVLDTRRIQPDRQRQ
jgi:hypothetical protein